MLRCAASFVVAAYPKVRITPRDLRALPADFLQSRPHFDFLRVHQDCVTSPVCAISIFQSCETINMVVTKTDSYHHALNE
jgi:hypothetical protein